MSSLVARKQIIDKHSGPLAILAESHLIRPLVAVVLHHHHFLHQVFSLCQHGQRTQQPTVTQHSCNPQQILSTSPYKVLHHNHFLPLCAYEFLITQDSLQCHTRIAEDFIWVRNNANYWFSFYQTGYNFPKLKFARRIELIVQENS